MRSYIISMSILFYIIKCQNDKVKGRSQIEGE